MSGGRICIQNLIDSAFEFRSPLLQDVQCLQTILQLSSISSTNKSRIKVLVFNGPSQSKMQQLASKLLLSNIRKLLQITEIFFISIAIVIQTLQQLDRKRTIFIIESVQFSLRQTFEVFSCKETTSKGRPSNKAIAVVFVQAQILEFIFCPCEHTILILCANRLMEVKSFAYRKCIEDAFGIPVGSGPIESLPVLNDLIESPADFFEGRVVVVEMSVEDVNVVHLQPLKGALNAFSDVLSVGC